MGTDDGRQWTQDEMREVWLPWQVLRRACAKKNVASYLTLAMAYRVRERIYAYAYEWPARHIRPSSQQRSPVPTSLRLLSRMPLY